MTAALFSSFSPDGIFRPPKLPPVQPPLEKHRPPCLTTAPPPPPWAIRRPTPRLCTPERRLRRSEARRGLRSPPWTGPKLRMLPLFPHTQVPLTARQRAERRERLAARTRPHARQV